MGCNEVGSWLWAASWVGRAKLQGAPELGVEEWSQGWVSGREPRLRPGHLPLSKIRVTAPSRCHLFWSRCFFHRASTKLEPSCATIHYSRDTWSFSSEETYVGRSIPACALLHKASCWTGDWWAGFRCTAVRGHLFLCGLDESSNVSHGCTASLTSLSA